MWDILSKAEKDEILAKLIIYVSKVDGQIVDNELGYIQYVGSTLEIPSDIFDKYLQSDISNINEILPSDELERSKILYHLLFTINADHVIGTQEEHALYNLSFKLGFNESMTREFIDLMKTYALDDLPDQAMIQILRKYNN
jgi:hypothetical protein